MSVATTEAPRREFSRMGDAGIPVEEQQAATSKSYTESASSGRDNGVEKPRASGRFKLTDIELAETRAKLDEIYEGMGKGRMSTERLHREIRKARSRGNIGHLNGHARQEDTSQLNNSKKPR